MAQKRKNDTQDNSSSEESEYSEKSSPLIKRVRKEPVEKKADKKPKTGAKGSGSRKAKSTDNKVNKFMVDLGKKKRVTVDIFKGQPLVNIREFYVVDGEERPGKKGIALTVEQWHELRENVEVINNHIKKITKE